MATTNTYGFDCPECGDYVEKHADERVVRLLLSGGVMPVLIHVPAEALESRNGLPSTTTTSCRSTSARGRRLVRAVARHQPAALSPSRRSQGLPAPGP